MLKVIADDGVVKVKSPKFANHKQAYKWLTPYYVKGYKVTILGKAKR